MIDSEAGLVFDNEKELIEYFSPQIKYFEEEYKKRRQPTDLDEDEVKNLENELEETLDSPAEIWHDDKTFKEFPVFYFVRPIEELQGFHVAVTYVSSDDEPTFIFLHFVTRHLDTLEGFRKGDLVYDKAFEEVGFGAIEGDTISEGDPLAMGLFLAMLKVRGEKDIPFEKFQQLGIECREETIEHADEIWRSSDLHGNVLVTFIKEFPEHEIPDLWYVAITAEDQNSAVHSLLFSFPSNDENLLDRYRHGENLQADEVVQESSH